MQAEVPKLEPQIEFSVGIFSHELVKHLNFTVRHSGAILRRNLPRTFHQLLLFCSVASPAPPVLAARESHDPHLLACAGMAVNIHPFHLDHAEQLLGAPGAPAVRSSSGWVLRSSEPLGGARARRVLARRVLHLRQRSRGLWATPLHERSRRALFDGTLVRSRARCLSLCA